MADRFSGFPMEAVEFLEDLELHNERGWFHARKDVYERTCRHPMELLLAELEPRYGGGKMFRIQRDVRFSKDKTPYKTYISASFGGGYLSLSPEAFYVATGSYMLDREPLARYREAAAADDSGAELARIIAALKKKGYEVGGHGELKVVPRGFPRDHPRADLLRQKSVLIAKRHEIEPWLATRKVLTAIDKVLRDAKPMNDWLAQNLA